MPRNTSYRDIFFLCEQLGNIHKARKAEWELSFYRKRGKLPEDAEFIERVVIVNGQEVIELKEGV